METRAAADGLSAVVERVPGLRLIVVSGDDGIPLLKYPVDDMTLESHSALDSAYTTSLDQVIHGYVFNMILNSCI